jgi:hypothetical protein
MHPKQTAIIAPLTAESGEVCHFTNGRRMYVYQLTKILLAAERKRKSTTFKE